MNPRTEMIHIDIQISKYLVGTCVLSRYDSWVRKNKPATGLQPAAVRVDLLRKEGQSSV